MGFLKIIQFFATFFLTGLPISQSCSCQIENSLCIKLYLCDSFVTFSDNVKISFDQNYIEVSILDNHISNMCDFRRGASPPPEITT